MGQSAPQIVVVATDRQPDDVGVELGAGHCGGREDIARALRQLLQLPGHDIAKVR